MLTNYLGYRGLTSTACSNFGFELELKLLDTLSMLRREEYLKAGYMNFHNFSEY